MTTRRLAAGVVVIVFPLMASAQSPPLVVLSSNATRAVLQQLEPALAQVTARTIEFRFANSAELRFRIQQGEQFDVAVLSAGAIDELAANGSLIPASRSEVASAGVGVAIRKGSTAPDVSTPDALKKTLLAARSVAFVGQGATAPIIRGLFDRFGIAAEMQSKIRLVPGAAEAVARGEAELGFTQISEILPVAGATLAGPLPEPLQVLTRFAAAVATNSRTPDLSRALVAVMTSTSAAAAITASGMQPAAADRLPPIPPAQMTDAQSKAAAEFTVIRNGAGLSGPFFPLLRSPELMVRASALGEYLRYRSALPPRLSEFVILLTAREWDQQYEWNAHYGLARKAGVSAEMAGAIADGRRPAGMAADHEALYDFCDELLRTKAVSDQTYQRAVALFGEQGVVDTVGIVGYYSMLAMVLNTARTPAGTSTAPLLRPLGK